MGADYLVQGSDFSFGKSIKTNAISSIGPGSNGFKKGKEFLAFVQKSKGKEVSLGGTYKNVPSNGGEVHHMPANSVSPLSRGNGSSVRMETPVHRQTASWGNSREARAYRAQQKALIDRGEFNKAQNMDIFDLRNKFGNKYDESIRQMLDYTKGLK